MAISEQDQATILRWSGPIEDPAAAEAAITRLGRAEVAALEILQTRLALMLAEPIQQNIADDVSWNAAANIRGLERSIDKLAGLCSRLDGLTPEAQQIVDFLADTVGDPAPQSSISSYEIDNARPG